jgi:acetolactate synthase-1/2/3 large subunit
MKKKVSDIIVEFLISKKIYNVFSVSGGASIHMIHSAAKNKNIKCSFNHHEQASAMAADGVAKSTGLPSCVFATSGPGATNLITGICCSWFDSTPNLFITGQVTTFRLKKDLKIRQLGFQETDIISMVAKITKYAVQIKKAENILYELEKAYHLSLNGRKGPVLIDIPDDIQRQFINYKSLNKYKKKKIKKKLIGKKHIQNILKFINKSKRPTFIFGGGANINYNKILINKIIKKFQIPFLTTWGAKHLMNSSELNSGTFGTHGTRHGNFTIQNSDLLIIIGSKLGTRETGNLKLWAREAKVIMIDIDISEITKFKRLGRKIDYKIVADSTEFLRKLNFVKSKDIKNNFKNWIKQVDDWKKYFKNNLKVSNNHVDPYYFFYKLSEFSKENTDFYLETGSVLAWFMQIFNCKESQRIFHDFNFTAMGWALPASIGANINNKDRNTICISGDGSFMMNIQELSFINKDCKNFKIFLINNGGYSMIRQTEKEWLNGKNYGSTNKDLIFPNFKKISQAHDLNYIQIKNKTDVEKITEVLKSRSNFLCEVFIPNQKEVIPQVKFGRALEDGHPLLSRKIMHDQMIIKPLR